MSNKVKDIDVKSRRNYFFNDIINTKNFYLNNSKIDEKSEKIFLFTTFDMQWFEDLKYVKNYSVNSSYIFFKKMNEYFKEINVTKTLTLVPPNKTKEKIRKYEELLSKMIIMIIMIIMKNIVKSILTHMKSYL